MKRFLTILLLVAFVFSFIVAVKFGSMSNGHFVLTKRFSALNYVENISENFESLPSFEKLSDFWTKDSYQEIVHGENSFGAVTVYFEDYDGDNPILEFFDSVRGFFRRLYQSFKWVGEWFIKFFTVLPSLVPWNENSMEDVE